MDESEHDRPDPGNTDPGNTDRERADREWAEAANRIGTPPQGRGSTPGAGGHPDPAEGATPRHLRVGRGPRFSGRGVLAVFGLLGILLTVGLMTLLAVRVLDATDPVPGLPGQDSGPGDTDGAEPPPEEAEPSPPQAPLDAARAAECETERATIEVAVLAYEVTTGSSPSELQTLVEFGVLAGPVAELSHRIGADGQLVATDTCAG